VHVDADNEVRLIDLFVIKRKQATTQNEKVPLIEKRFATCIRWIGLLFIF